MTAAARNALSSVVHFLSAHVWRREEVRRPEQQEHRVGKYYADYSERTAAQLAEPQPELEKLFKNSKTISVKRES